MGIRFSSDSKYPHPSEADLLSLANETTAIPNYNALPSQQKKKSITNHWTTKNTAPKKPSKPSPSPKPPPPLMPIPIPSLGVFERLPELGVFNIITSFLDLPDAATVMTLSRGFQNVIDDNYFSELLHTPSYRHVKVVFDSLLSQPKPTPKQMIKKHNLTKIHSFDSNPQVIGPEEERIETERRLQQFLFTISIQGTQFGLGEPQNQILAPTVFSVIPPPIPDPNNQSAHGLDFDFSVAQRDTIGQAILEHDDDEPQEISVKIFVTSKLTGKTSLWYSGGVEDMDGDGGEVFFYMESSSLKTEV